MATTVDNLILRVEVDAKTGALKPVAEDLQKLAQRSDLAGTAVDKLEKSVNRASIAFERKQRAVNNSRESIIRAQSAFIGFGGTLGQVTGHVFDLTNQIETLEFNAKKAGKSIDIFNDSALSSAKALGGLGTAALVAGAAIAGWKIGRWIADITGLDNAILKVTDRLINFKDVSGEDAQRLEELNHHLQDSLWEKYGIQVDTAGLSVLEANKKLLAAATTVNQLNIAMKNAGTELQNLQNDLSVKFQESQMTAEELLLKRHKQIEAERLAMSKSTNAAEVAEHKKKIAELLTQEEQFSERYANESKQRAEAGIKEAQRMAKAIQKAFEDAIKKGPQEVGFALDLLTDKITTDTKAWEEFGKKLGLIASGGFEDLFNNIQNLAPAEKTLMERTQELSGWLDKNAESLKINVKWTDELAKASLKLADTLSQVAGIFGALADAFGSNTLGSIANAIGGAGQAAQGFGEIMSGDVLQGIQDVIAGVGNLFNALKELFGHNWKKDAENIISAIHGISGASDEFIQSVADLAKKIGDADTALILSLRGLIDDVGITADNVAQIFQLEHDVFSFLERGQITVQQASDIIGSTFDDLVAAAEKFGGVYQQQLTDIIALSRQFGLDVPAITAYVNEQIGKMIEGISTLTQQFSSLVDKSFQKFTDGLLSEDGLNRVKRRFDELARYTLVAMSQILQNGGTMVDVFTQLHDPFAALQDAAEKFGLKGSKSFQKLMDAYEKFNSPKTQRLLAQIEIIQAEQALGVELTKHEKHLLKIAEEQGLIKADPMQQVADAVRNDLVPAIQDLIDELRTLTGQKWTVDVVTNYTEHHRRRDRQGGGGADGGGNLTGAQLQVPSAVSTNTSTETTNNNRLTINVYSSASNARALAQDLEPYIEKFLRNGTISRKDGSRF